MILADTSVWIDFLRGSQQSMRDLLLEGRIVMHPFIVAEVALGSLKSRKRTLELMESLWQVKVASLDEVRAMIEAHRLYSRGLGLIDAHLLASCLVTPGTLLWTRDRDLGRAAQELRVQAALP